MPHNEVTATAIRLLIYSTIEKPIIDARVLERIVNSDVPFNPIHFTDAGTTEDRFALGQAFEKELARGVDWAAIQQEAMKLRRTLATHEKLRLRAQEETRWLPTSVPILVDAVRAGGLVRLNYLCIECDTPKVGWALDVLDSWFPFLLLGMSGVILHPFDSFSFDKPQQIDKLFDTVENKLGFDVAVGDLWLPTSAFTNLPVAPMETGSVFRVDLELFRRAYSLRETPLRLGTQEERSSWNMAFDLLGKLPHPEFSPRETEVFADWSEQQVADLSERNPKNEEPTSGEEEEL